MENSGEISIVEALNHIQSWLNAGEYDKVIQGAQEILAIEPGNPRALALLKQAEERRHTATVEQTTPQAAPAPTAPVNPMDDPLQSLQVEPKPTPAPAPAPVQAPAAAPVSEVRNPYQDDGFEKKKLFLAMLIPAVLVILIGGAAIWWLSHQDREEEIQEVIGHEDQDNGIVDTEYLDRNEDRVEDITKMERILEQYKQINGKYPSVSQIESVLAQSDEFESIPSDPRQGEIDKAGRAFGYIYAVYSGIGGADSVYVLSALFEDSEGFGSPWAKGAPVKNYPDYRDYELENVVFIGGDESEIGKGENDVTEEDEGKKNEDDNGPKTGPKVNPDN